MKKPKITGFILLLLFIAFPAFAGETYLSDPGLGLSAVAGLFFLGLALNLTPCVYPMLTVTLAVFGTGREKKKIRIITKAILYVMGIATMYSLLGLIAALSGGLFGGIMQSRAVLAGVGILFILLALSMFGLWEIRPPSRLVNRVSGKTGAGYIGIYLSGLLVGVFAAPCVGPPIIALMTTVGQRGDPFYGFASFFILSLGLGFPYLLLAVFSSLIPRLPKSGSWMVWVRKVLGVILVAVAFFYLSLAAGQNLVFILIPAVLAAGGIYLAFIENTGADKKIFTWIKYIMGAVFIVAAFFIFRSGRIPSVKWQPYDAQILSGAENPSVVYFAADWCVPCLEMEVRTFSVPEVMNSLEGFNLMKADLTSYETPSSRHLRQKYDIAGVPTIIFIDKEGDEISPARKVGFISSRELIDTTTKVKQYLQTGRYEHEKEVQEKKEPSTAKLISDVQWIQPGEPFYIGMLFEIEQDWHLYWINPGDSGMAPQIEWDIPEGFSTGDTRWPHPQRFQEEPFFTFGHEEYLLLSRKITPPADLKPGSKVRFAAEANWLACMDICISQQGESKLTMEVRDESPPPNERREKIFTQTEKSLPSKAPRWKFSFQKNENNLILYANPPEEIKEDIIENSEFFPLQPGLLRSDPAPWIRSGDIYKKEMRLEDPPGEIDILEGVLVLPENTQGIPRALRVEAAKDQLQ
ncbi:MAG: cytochrome c biogenesis protein CcdA [Elusimicrobiota bacterium]